VSVALPSSARERLPWLAVAVGAMVVAGGLYLRRAAGVVLGAPYPPSLGTLAPAADPLLAVSIGCFAAAVALAPRLLDRRIGAATVTAMLLGGTLVLRLALAAGRGGTGAWDGVFDPGRSFEAANEYLAALPSLSYGRGFFLDRFAELVPSLPVHAAGHPPGLLLVADALGLTTPARLAALCIGVGALSAPLTYAVGRILLPERGARLAGLLMAFAPGALMFGVTSADALYCTLGLLAAWPLVARSWRVRLVGALVLAVASLFAWSLLAVGAWAVLLAVRREGWRPALALAALMGVVLLAVQGAFAAATGFDPIGTLHATGEVYRSGVAAMRPYWYWVLGSPVGFLLVLGIPISWFALRGLTAASPEATAIFAVLAIASVAGFTKAETERIWLFFGPFVCLAAAPVLAGRRAPVVVWVLSALAAQALLHQLLFDTVW
jgi:methylthioxylose transferase